MPAPPRGRSRVSIRKDDSGASQEREEILSSGQRSSWEEGRQEAVTACRIEWRDHHGSRDDSWWSKEEIARRAARGWLMTTVGEVIYENDDCVVLASQQYVDGANEVQHRGWIAIMKALIQSRVELQEKGP